MVQHIDCTKAVVFSAGGMVCLCKKKKKEEATLNGWIFFPFFSQQRPPNVIEMEGGILYAAPLPPTPHKGRALMGLGFGALNSCF